MLGSFTLSDVLLLVEVSRVLLSFLREVFNGLNETSLQSFEFSKRGIHWLE